MNAETVDTISEALGGIAFRMRGIAFELGTGGALRETKHLEPSTVAQLNEAIPRRIVEKNRKHPIPSWPNVGNVDVLVHPGSHADRLIAVELKWCHTDKLYEGIWDLFKMALLSTADANTYLITGATPADWEKSVGSELFEDAIHHPSDLCEVRLAWGQKLRAWDDLLCGGYDRFPLAVPSRIRTTAVGHESFDSPDGSWELRAVRVDAAGSETTAFEDGWPFPRPSDAVRPLAGLNA